MVVPTTAGVFGSTRCLEDVFTFFHTQDETHLLCNAKGGQNLVHSCRSPKMRWIHQKFRGSYVSCKWTVLLMCTYMLFSNSRQKKRKVSEAREWIFTLLPFSDYYCFGSWRPVMETWLSVKFVAVCRSTALHSNQQLSHQPGPLLMTATNCLTNSLHYLRASVKQGYTLSQCASAV